MVFCASAFVCEQTFSTESPEALITAVPCNFTFVDIQTPFWHVPHAPLGLLGGKGVEVVNKWCLVSYLKVPDAAVTLRTQSQLNVMFLKGAIKGNKTVF